MWAQLDAQSRRSVERRFQWQLSGKQRVDVGVDGECVETLFTTEEASHKANPTNQPAHRGGGGGGVHNIGGTEKAPQHNT